MRRGIFSSIQGRFTIPDEFNGGPVEVFTQAASSNPTFYADLTNPQSMNKYQYCLNNPLKYIDPDGHDPVDQDGKKLDSREQSIVQTIGASLVRLGNPICMGLSLLIDPPSVGAPTHENSNVGEGKTAREALKTEGIGIAAAVVVGPFGRKLARNISPKALEDIALKELSKRFTVRTGEAIAKDSRVMADFIDISKSGKSAVVQEVTTGSKTVTHLKDQLTAGIDQLHKEGFTGTIKPIVRTTDARLAAQVRKELPKVRGRNVQVILHQ